MQHVLLTMRGRVFDGEEVVVGPRGVCEQFVGKSLKLGLDEEPVHARESQLPNHDAPRRATQVVVEQTLYYWLHDEPTPPLDQEAKGKGRAVRRGERGWEGAERVVGGLCGGREEQEGGKGEVEVGAIQLEARRRGGLEKGVRKWRTSAT